MKTISLALLNSRLFRIRFDRSFLGDWTLKFHFGHGAGYINGFSAWVANAANSQFFGERKTVRMYQRHFSFGVTRNGNRLPWTRN